MKYVVLSFDDGLHDFIDYVLPVLNKYNIKASINICAKFSMDGFADGAKCISPTEVKALFEQGHEIAIHSYSHLRKETPDDFSLALQTIQQWIGEDYCRYGAVMPHNGVPSSELESYFVDNNYLYVALRHKTRIKKDFQWFLIRFLHKIFKSGYLDWLYQNYYSLNDILSCRNPLYVNRLNIWEDTDPNWVIGLLKLMNKKKYATIMFHSIVGTVDDNTVFYKKGSWKKEYFIQLIEWIMKNKKRYKIITQIEATELKHNDF